MTPRDCTRRGRGQTYEGGPTIIEDSKTCSRCGETKPRAEFQRGSNGRQSRCKPCNAVIYQERMADPGKRAERNAYARAYAKAHRPQINAARKARRADPEYARRERERDRARHPDKWIREQYGLTRERWDAMLAAQGGKCAICGRPDGRGNGKTNHFHVDHDHTCCPGRKTCGKCVRGLLCNSCNPMLGYVKEDLNILRAAADYLERWKEVMSLDDQSAR